MRISILHPRLVRMLQRAQRVSALIDSLRQLTRPLTAPQHLKMGWFEKQTFQNFDTVIAVSTRNANSEVTYKCKAMCP